ncbi:DNRLRE domain-containing protein [Kitasatospora azatica]|uniref:DNRLRE domain-containing protein n=1 Tax=Kitasatospora azatica TaxID=58347 RepID=UPI000689713C|nr:DNRLRE domain-containing protein [Kitasatospora azatica]
MTLSQFAFSEAAHAHSSVHIQPPGDGNWKPGPKGKNTTAAYTKPAQHGGTQAAAADPHATRTKELTGKRTANSKLFQMSDGSAQEDLSAAPVHYQDAKGDWQDIDSTVKPLAHNGFTAGAEGNSFHTYFSSQAGSLVRLESGGASVQLGADGATVGSPKLTGSAAAYPGAWANTDLDYQVLPTGLKESIVLAKAPSATASYSFTLNLGGGLTPRRNPDGSIDLLGGESANPVMTIPAPYMVDAKDDKNSPYGKAYSSKVTQTMAFDAAGGTLRLTETPNAAWLADKARAYPVTIDPTVLVSPTSATASNVMISADGATTNYSTSWRLTVGTTTTGAARALIKFPMPSVPAGSTINSADLKLYYDQTVTTGSNNVPMQALQANASWSPTTATWSNASSIGGPVAGTSQMNANQVGVWDDFPVTSAVQNWISGSAANNGFVLRATNETPLGQGGPRFEGSIYAYGGEVVNYPKLTISYGIPGIAVKPPTVIHATGAELSWPAYTNTTGNTANDIAQYQVHRSVFQTFSPGADTEISPVDPSQTAFVDSTAVPTPANNSDPYGNAYYYMVAIKTKGGQLISGPTQLVRLPEAGRTTLLIPSVAATTLSSTLSTSVLNTLSNAGTPQPWLEVGDNSATYGVARSVLDFGQLSQVPAGSRILDAHLKLWQETTTTGSSGAVYELHGLTRSFTGNQATWNSAATGTAWTTAGGDYTAAPGGTLNGFTNDPNRRNFDATSTVQGWIDTAGSDHGLLLKLAGETSGSPQERTIFAGPGTAEPALAPTLVVTYLDSSTGSTYYAPTTPSDMQPGTTYTVPVTVNNTTSSTWAAAGEVLTYHWTLPDGTDVTGSSQLQTALPSDLAPGATATLNAQVTPPTPTDANQTGGYSLAWDMYNKTTGAYLSAGAPSSPSSPSSGGSAKAAVMSAGTTGGIGSLKQQISVDPTGNNQLGLEKFYQYTKTDTGSGSTLYTDNASGNTVWNDDLFSNPSRGFNTFLRLNYNSLDTTDTTTGFGWSLQASTPTRLGQALYWHPQQSPTTVAMKDGTGNAHQWTLNTATNPPSWTSPPGVHLWLQQLHTCGPQDTYSQAWSMTRPEGTVDYYDCEGYPTGSADRNGNFATFGYSDRQSENKPAELLTEITDPVGRTTMKVGYYLKGGSYSYIDSTGALQTGTNLTDPAIIDHVSSISDISGRTVNFYYSTNGLLERVVDGAGTSSAKTFNFSYDATQGMKNVKLVSVQDPRGNSTAIAYYPPSSATKWQTRSITDRDGRTTTFANTASTVSGAQTQSTVTDANNQPYVYQTDSAGRMVQVVNPLNQKTTMAWDADNNVTTLTEDNNAKTTWTYDANTGYPLTKIGAVANGDGTHYQTTYNYQFLQGGHIAHLTDLGSPGARHWHYTYDGFGNQLTAVDPNGTVSGAAAGSYTTSYTYDVFGQKLSQTDADGHKTTYANYDPSGAPGTVTDPLGNAGQMVYGQRGEVTATSDPLGNTTTQNYDVFLRRLDSSVPKDQRHAVYITTPAAVYDANDNTTQSTSATGAVSSAVFDPMDRITSTTLPQDTPTSPVRKVTYTYDAVGNRLTTTQPNGNLPTATAGSYTTTTGYDKANEATSVTDAAGAVTRTDYDDVGNKFQVTDPFGKISKLAYDLEHRVLSVTDALNHVASVSYDPDGYRYSTTDQNGVMTVYTTDSDGQVTQVNSPHTGTGSTAVYDTTQYTYDQVGNRTGVISPLGVLNATAHPGSYTTSTVFDADNRVSKKLGAVLPGDTNYGAPEQPESDYSYDPAGRISSVTQHTVTPQGTFAPLQSTATTSYTYYDNGWTQNSTDPFNIITSYDYDNAGRQAKRMILSEDGSGSRTQQWGHYPDGKLQSFQDSGLPAGWQSQIMLAGNAAASVANNTEWSKVSGDGADGADYWTASGSNTNVFQWNLSVPQDGNYSVYVHIPTNTSLTSAYASYTVAYNGGSTNPGILVNQNANQGQWVQLKTSSATEFNFKAGSGQSITLAPPGGYLVAADAVKIVRDNGADGTTVPESYSYVYDADGNRTDALDNTTGATFDDFHAAFNQLNQMTQLQENLAGTAKHTIGYTYDPMGRPKTQTFDARIDNYTYDAMGRLTSVLNQQSGLDPGLTTSYTYTPTGKPATEQKGNGNLLTATYNSDGTLASSLEATSVGTTVDSHTLTYDPNNNVVSDAQVLQNADTGAAMTRTLARSYSPNNQVTQVKNNGADVEDYIYDSAGNVSVQTVNQTQIGYFYDRGRMDYTQNQSATVPALPTGAYQYDTLGRLTAVTSGFSSGYVNGISQSYKYDAFDNILEQASTSGTTTNPVNNKTDYTYDTINRPLTETENDGSSTAQTSTFDYLGAGTVVQDETVTGFSAAQKVYDYSPGGERLGMINTNSGSGPGLTQYNYYSYSPHSDVEALTSNTGSTTATYDYTAYGVDTANFPNTWDSGTDKNSQLGNGVSTFPYNAYRFNSARVDTATSTLNMGARSYDPNINRFMTRDTFSGASADQAMAAAGNRYGFAGGNPVSNVEMDGHDWMSAVEIGLGAAAVVGGVACTIITEGGCLVAIGAAMAEGSAMGAGGMIGAGVFAAIMEGGAAIAGSMGVGVAAGVVAGAAALEESAAVDLAAADAGAADAGAAEGGAAKASSSEDAALEGEGSGTRCGGESFTADTKVALADGSTKAISTLRAGDKVKSTDTSTGKTKDSDVSVVEVKHDTDLYDLTVHTAKGDKVVNTTQHHLFYDRTSRSWVEAAKLAKGDELTTDDGSVATVEGGTVPAKSDGDMWDLTVPGDHDFYVEAGDTPVLVHNDNNPKPGDATCPIVLPTPPKLPASFKSKTVSWDGKLWTVSGGRFKLPSGFTRPAEPDMEQMAQDIGYEASPAEALKPGQTFLDNGEEGSYNLWHAEKQGSVLSPGSPLAVSKEVCDDCMVWFTKQAVFLNRSLYITDPFGVFRFDPDGGWTIIQ